MSLFRAQVSFVALVTVAMVCGSPLAAGTIWNTFGPGDSTLTAYSADTPGSGTSIMATTFTPSASASLTSIMGNWGSPMTSDTFVVSLWTDASGSPGSQLESWPLSPTAVPTNYTLTSALHPGLSSGESYWVLFAETYTNGLDFSWGRDSSAPAGGVWLGSTPGSLYQAFAELPIVALRVEGDEGDVGEPGTVPDPSVAILLLSGLLGVAALRHRLTRP